MKKALAPSLVVLACSALALPRQAQCLPARSLVEPLNTAPFQGSLALDGKTLVVGNLSADLAYLYEYIGGTWLRTTTLSPPVSTGSLVFFGDEVVLDGDTLAVGAPGDNEARPGSGAIFVFERDQGGAGAWGQTQKLSSANISGLGATMALLGDTLVAGQPDSSPGGRGASVFQRASGTTTWSETQFLAPPDNHTTRDFGTTVALSADTLLVGDPSQEVDGRTLAGAVYVYQPDANQPGAWSFVSKLFAPFPSAGANFGTALAIDGDHLAVSSSQNAKEVSVFSQSPGGGWVRVKRIVESTARIGRTIALEGDRLLVGAPGNLFSGTGSALLYERDLGGPENWGLVGTITEPSSFPISLFAWDGIAMDGTTTVISAYKWSRFVAYENVSLCADARSVSHATGATVTFSLDAGTIHAGEPYLLLGTSSGTTPGLRFGGALLPLNSDAYLRSSFTHANQSPFLQTFERLDGLGRATARLAVPPTWAAVQVGSSLHHAFAVLSPGAKAGVEIQPTRTVFVSNAVRLRFSP